MDIDNNIKDIKTQQLALENKLKELYKAKYGDVYDFQIKILIKLEESLSIYGYGKSLKDELEDNIPFSEDHVYNFNSNRCKIRIMDIELISETDFKVLGYDDFVNNTYSLERLQSGIYRHIDGDKYKMVFRSTVDEEFWVEQSLFENTNEFLEETPDYLDRINKTKDYLHNLRIRKETY